MIDATGNWTPNLPKPAAFPSACSRNVCVASGAPSASQGNDGDLIISRSDGTLYEKVDGVWVAFPGYTGSSGFNNQSGNGSPIGVATPNYVGQYYLKKTSPYDVYVAIGMTNTSWLLVVGELT